MATTPLLKPVTRAAHTPSGTALAVTLAPEGIYFRERGRRTRFLLPLGTAFVQAVRLEVARQKAEKAAAKKVKGKKP